MALANILQNAPTLKETTLNWPANRRQKLGAQMSQTMTPTVIPQIAEEEQKKRRRPQQPAIGNVLGPEIGEKLGG